MQHFHENLLEPKLALHKSELPAFAEIPCTATLYHTLHDNSGYPMQLTCIACTIILSENFQQTRACSFWGRSIAPPEHKPPEIFCAMTYIYIMYFRRT